MLDKCSSYTLTVVWKFAWVDSALVVLVEWSSFIGDYLTRSDCNTLEIFCLSDEKMSLDFQM